MSKHSYVCLAVVGKDNPSRPDRLEFCADWALPDSDYCERHQTEEQRTKALEKAEQIHETRLQAGPRKLKKGVKK